MGGFAVPQRAQPRYLMGRNTHAQRAEVRYLMAGFGT
jgi:hypothetical protein